MIDRLKFSLGKALLLFLILLGLALIARNGAPTPDSFNSREARADLAGLEGMERSLYLADPAEVGESENLVRQGDYWAHRVSYPTGRFEPSWLLSAYETNKEIPEALPAGDVIYERAPDAALALDPTQFTALGPAPLDMTGCQGCFDYGIVGGRTNVIVSDPVDPSVAYFGSDGGGVWKSENCCSSATTWTPVTDDPLLNSIAIGDITLDPNDHNTVYAGTGDLRYGSWSFGSAGLLKSTDAGATWEIKGADVFNAVYDDLPGEFPQYQAIGKVRVDPNNSNIVVVGTKQGVYFSYDAGDNWDGPCYTNGFNSQRQDSTGMLVSDQGSSTWLYVAIGTRGFNTTVQPDLDQNGANGIYRTTIPASGCPANWDLITRADNGWPGGTGGGTPYPTNTLGRIDIAMAPSDPDIIYAQVASIPSRGQLGVWRTLDGGTTWTQRSNVSGLTGCFGDWPQNWYDQGLAIDPNDPDVVFMSTVDLFRSTNGGSSFVNLTCGYAGGSDDVHVDHHALAFVDGTSTDLLVGTDGGMYLTENADSASATGVAFSQLNDSLNTIEFYSGDITADFANSSSPGINAGAQDNGSSVKVWTGDPGPAEWQMTTGGDGMYARIEPVAGQRWYQESQNGNLKVSTTGPNGFFVGASGGWGGDTLSFIMPYDINKYGDCVPICSNMIAGTHRVWETTSGAVPASSWYVNSGNLTKNTLGNRSFINELTYATSDDSMAVVGTNDGNFWFGFDMGQGTTNSATWVDVTGSNSVLPNRPIMDVGTDPLNALIGYAALGGFDENTPATPGHVYQVTCTANCASFTWVNKSGNLPNVPINAIQANPLFPQQVFAGSDWGVYFTDDITEASPTWHKFTAGLPSVMIWDMTIDRGFTTLALFTRSRGAYAWPLTSGPLTAVTMQSADIAPTAEVNTVLVVTVAATLLTATAVGSNWYWRKTKSS